MTINTYVKELFEDRGKLFAFKKVNKIYLKHIAEYIGVSISCVSQFDSNKINMGERNIEKYKEFISNHIKDNKDSKLK